MLAIAPALASGADEAQPPRLIAHAGGGVDGRTYTNSKEALDASAARGFQLVEVDFEFTRDGHLVLAHDWSDFAKLFDIGEAEAPLLLAEFQAAKPLAGLTQLSLADLGRWLDQHPTVDIVTDFKQDQDRGLQIIARELPDQLDRFVAQIYLFEDSATARELGFERRILTVYRSPLSTDMVKRWIAKHAHEVYAVTIPLRRAKTTLVGILEDAGVFVYTHTINDPKKIQELSARGIDGFYTDWLTPGDPPAQP